MPRKYTKRKKHRRRRRTNGVPRNLVGFPKTRLVNMRYNENFSLDAIAGGVANQQFRINSINDPNFTGVGHQPLGHDEWALYYNHYVVIGAKMTATFLSTEIGTPTGLRACGIYLSEVTGVVPTNVIDMIENGKSKWKYLSPVGQSGQSKTTITNTFSAKSFFSVTNISDNVNRIGGNFGTNPFEDAIMNVWTGNPGTGDPNALVVDIVIDFVVICSEPKTLGRS